MSRTQLCLKTETTSSLPSPESGASTAPTPPPPAPSPSGLVDAFEVGAGLGAGPQPQRMSVDERFETFLRRIDRAFTHPATTAVVFGVTAGLGLATGLEVTQEGMSWAAGRDLLTYAVLMGAAVGVSGTRPPVRGRAL